MELTHLTPKGHLKFNFPGVVSICSLKHKGKGEVETITMNQDMIFMEPDERTFWRVAPATGCRCCEATRGN